jgi:anti-sigma-K factor RskA
MIDERNQELAALHALDLLEGQERAAFEASLAGDAELSNLVRELRESAADFALTAPQLSPPPALKTRLMERISSTSSAPASSAKIVTFPRSVVVPWAIAASFAVGCGWLSHLYFTSESERIQLRDQQTLAAMEVRGAEVQVEAERVISKHDMENARKQISDLSQQVAASTAQLAERDKAIAALGQKLESLNSASESSGKLLSEAREQIASLNEKIQTQGDLAQFKIATLASLAGNSQQALAVAVWNPNTQQGILSVAKLPALASDKDYQLWLIDPAYPAPVDGGVFTVNPATGDARIKFTPNQRVNNASKFAVSLERKGGVKKAEGPILLLGD